MSTHVLHLVLTYHWYDETASGRKTIEYRAMTEKWRKQIWEKRDTATTQTFAIDKIDIGECPIEGWNGHYYRIHFISPAITSLPGNQNGYR